MLDYIKIIADKINAGTPVIFYTVGGDTFSCIKELKHRFAILPSAVCDADPKKHGRTYKGLEGLVVMSIETALQERTDAEIFIPSMDYIFDIIGYLTENHIVPPEKIINYEPVEKRRSCSFLEKSIFYDRDGSLIYCCNVPGLPRIPKNCTNQFFTFRKGLTETLKNNADTETTYAKCKGCQSCSYIKENYYPVDQKSWWLNYFAANGCNYRCEYCTVSHMEDKDRDNLLDLDVLLKTFKDNGMLSERYGIIYSTSGEPTLHPKKTKFYNAFDGFAFVVNTNGSIFDEELFDLANRAKVRLVVSIDAGTRETYAKIKRVDSFEKAKLNLTQYAKANIGLIALKYLLMPGVNDNADDINGFVDFCVDTECTYVVISFDYYSESKLDEKTMGAIQLLMRKLDELDILVVPYTAYESPEYSAKIRALLLEGNV